MSSTSIEVKLACLLYTILFAGETQLKVKSPDCGKLDDMCSYLGVNMRLEMKVIKEKQFPVTVHVSTYLRSSMGC